jgi:alginate O-acetyltransferase complex protein AlgJ
MSNRTTITIAGASGSEDRARTSQRLLAGAFLALFLAASLVVSLANPALLRSPRRPVVDGSWMAAYQEAFDTNSPLFGPATVTWGVIEYVLFREGRSGVLVGSDGWLFSREEFEHPSAPAAAAASLAASLDAVAAVRDRLEADGVRLVVALLPAKARVYGENLGRYRLPEAPERRYDAALTGLKARDVTAVDLLGPLAEAKSSVQVFLRTDTHWSPAGAAVVADALAGALARQETFPWLGAAGFVTTDGTSMSHRGDLARFLPLGALYERLGPPDDTVLRATTTAVSAPETNLFADVELPVALVGTSYSEDARWNFAGALREALGSDILVAARQGSGPFEPMLDYLEGAAYRNAPPHVVLWEIPERYLYEPWAGPEEDS